jgi:hypothetical protein
MSALLPKVDIVQHDRDVCFVPIVDTAKTSNFGSSPLACIQYDIKHHQFRLQLHLRGWLQ